MAKISTLVDQIDSRTILIPEFQRGFVWRRYQIENFMRSLYLGYPIGSFLSWESDLEPNLIRGDVPLNSGTKFLLLDGQQRMTTLYSTCRGRPPEFFEGDPELFSGLMFDLSGEVFSFSPEVQERRGVWINVTDAIQRGPGQYLEKLRRPASQPPDKMLNRLTRLTQVLEREVHNEVITSGRYSTDTVVDIFNQVNSAGTPLSTADLALARICVRVPGARARVRESLCEMESRGWRMNTESFLRVVLAIATGRVTFTNVADASAIDLDRALQLAPTYLSTALTMLEENLGIDSDGSLFGREALPVLATALHLSGGSLANETVDKAVYWFLLAGIQGRYERNTERALDEDLRMLEAKRIEGLLEEICANTAGTYLIADLLQDPRRRSLAIHMLYCLTRKIPGRDLCTGEVLSLTETPTPLKMHRIFPRARLREIGLPTMYTDDIANCVFVTPASAGRLRGNDPQESLAQVPAGSQDVLESQNLPTDPAMWRMHKYLEFLDERRDLLTQALGRLIDTLADAAGQPRKWDGGLNAWSSDHRHTGEITAEQSHGIDKATRAASDGDWKTVR